MTRENRMDEVIKRYGFEDNRTLFFCNMAEDLETPDNLVEEIYNALMKD